MARILPVKAWIRWTEAGNQYEGRTLADARSGDLFWCHAEVELKRIARREEKPDAIGYAKTEVRVEFADGAVYDARLDLKHPNNTDNDCSLSAHIGQFCAFYAGRWRPAHLTEAQYKDLLSRHGDETVKAYERWLDQYALSDAQISEAAG